MSAMGEMKEERKWTTTDIEIQTVDGPRTVRALIHGKTPGLAVTMHQFGTFAVTHILTGMRIAEGWERCGSAALAAARLSRCADWTKTADELKAELARTKNDLADIPGSDMTKGQVYHLVRAMLPGDDFSWESSKDDPWNKAWEIIHSPRTQPDAADIKRHETQPTPEDQASEGVGA